MNKTLFVKGLPWAIQSQDLREIFAEHGEVVFARVLFDKETKKSKGCGFVEFTDEQTAADVMNKLNGSELQGRKIFIDFAKPREERPMGA